MYTELGQTHSVCVFILQDNGEIDNSFFAPDCFHLSQKGHYGIAYMLWNVMVTTSPFIIHLIALIRY